MVFLIDILYRSRIQLQRIDVLIVTACLLLFANSSVLAQENHRPLAEQQAIAQSIKDLDDDSYTVREKASERLRKFGGHALPALDKVLNTKNEEYSLEQRKRAVHILENIRDDSLKRANELADQAEKQLNGKGRAFREPAGGYRGGINGGVFGKEAGAMADELLEEMRKQLYAYELSNQLLGDGENDDSVLTKYRLNLLKKRIEHLKNERPRLSSPWEEPNRMSGFPLSDTEYQIIPRKTAPRILYEMEFDPVTGNIIIHKRELPTPQSEPEPEPELPLPVIAIMSAMAAGAISRFRRCQRIDVVNSALSKMTDKRLASSRSMEVAASINNG